jgi:hypothetical protein
MMLTNEQLNEMERVLSFNNVLPKREARQLIAAYRELIEVTPHVQVPTETASTNGVLITKRNRRKKNETLDSEA